jgi:hypothetical protein
LKFFDHAKKHGREGHEMAIKTRDWGGKKWKKEGKKTMRTRGKYWQD